MIVDDTQSFLLLLQLLPLRPVALDEIVQRLRQIDEGVLLDERFLEGEEGEVESSEVLVVLDEILVVLGRRSGGGSGGWSLEGRGGGGGGREERSGGGSDAAGGEWRWFERGSVGCSSERFRERRLRARGSGRLDLRSRGSFDDHRSC